MEIIKNTFNEKVRNNVTNDPRGAYQDFVDTLSKNMNINLTLFFHNLKTLTVHYKLFNISSDEADYNALFNHLIISKNINKYKQSIMHELLHLASTILIDGHELCGFSQTDIRTLKSIGQGLTEGYTTLLDERYFGDYEEHKKSMFPRIYIFSKSVAESLELIVGKDDMEKWYFNADLDSLLHYLDQFMSRSDNLKFLHNVDLLSLYGDSLKKINVKKVLSSYEAVNHYLIKLYLNTIIKDYSDGKYTDEALNELIDVAKVTLNKGMHVKGLKIMSARKLSDKEINEEVVLAKKKYNNI